MIIAQKSVGANLAGRNLQIKLVCLCTVMKTILIAALFAARRLECLRQRPILTMLIVPAGGYCRARRFGALDYLNFFHGGERDTVPINILAAHYDGCILCLPVSSTV
jgi:hypothetical protein